MKRQPFSRVQKLVITGCVAAYVIAYFNRLNLSAVLGAIGETLAISKSKAGSLQTTFALVYAGGQLVNGMLADRVDSARHIALGMIGFAISNLMLGLSNSYPMLMVGCVLNGITQSMLWAPIVRMVAIHFKEPAQRATANALLSATLVFGHLGAWFIAGEMAAYFDWHWSFRVPCVIGLAAAYPCYKMLRSGGRADRAAMTGSATAKSDYTFSALISTGLPILLGCCVLYGFVRDGIVTWSPTLLGELVGGANSTLVTLIIPCINAVGIYVAIRLRSGRLSNTRRCVSVMLVATALFCLMLQFAGSALLTALFMGLACAAMYGANPLMTSIVPQEYERYNAVAMVAGLVDCTIYLGSSLAGVLGGTLTDVLGAQGLYLIWVFAAVGAALLAFWSGSKAILRRL